MHLSLHVGEPLNSKVIKSFVPELRSRKCFWCFEIPMFHVYMLWTFYARFAYPYHGYGTSACAIVFSFLARFRYLSLFLLSFNFTLFCPDCEIHNLAGSLHLSFLLLTITSWCLVTEIRGHPREIFASVSLEWILACTNTTCSYCQI